MQNLHEPPTNLKKKRKKELPSKKINERDLLKISTIRLQASISKELDKENHHGGGWFALYVIKKKRGKCGSMYHSSYAILATMTTHSKIPFKMAPTLIGTLIVSHKIPP